ncbi:RIO1-domain-containing protein [Aureobasidium sp. EXF-12298]|nr:RIO1-domain-containing protein [Aureobasidium sp. EXF-12298]KAI4763538.1 RIO1-domain-containing protein [Aureobasidium sp. EXF-12344]KAI4780653.1 RIO1-domain-containing protein [Aureobasidium sp. EXF-3400]
MKLDSRQLRYLTAEDWRVLTAVEMGSKNHELVPTVLIAQIAGLRGGSGVHKSIATLAKSGLVAKIKNAKYDGYRLTYGGLDYLSLNSLRRTDTVFSLGNQIGVGKESDIYVVADPTGKQLVLKLHRLGRISFRTVKANRDYLRNKTTGSWMYLSRLAAMKEYAFMQVLKREGFPVPEPIAQTRHTLVMELIDSFPLRSIDNVSNPLKLYGELMDLIVRLAQVGLIHGDFNEFNLLIKEDPVTKKSTPILIDFPQMLSTTHENAKWYFDRDVNCIKRFFSRQFKFTSDEPGPFFEDATKDSDKNKRLDIEVEATGFSRKMAKDLDRFVEAVGFQNEAEEDTAEALEDPDSHEVDREYSNGEEEEDEEEEEEEEEETNSQTAQEDQTEQEAHTDSLDNPEPQDAAPALTAENLAKHLEPLNLQDQQEEYNATVEQQKKKKKAAGWSI